MEQKLKFSIASAMLVIEAALILMVWLLAIIWDPRNPLSLFANLSTALLLVFAVISISSMYWGYEKKGTRTLALAIGMMGIVTLIATSNSFIIVGFT